MTSESEHSESEHPESEHSESEHPADAELAVRAASGDQTALAAIFDRYAGRLLAFCVSMLHSRPDAEDCLQDVFVLAATRLGGLREPDRLRSWLFAVARHECLARIRKSGRELPVDTIADRPADAGDEPAEQAMDAELAELLAAAVAGLPERDRVALELADRQGLSTDEVAAVLGMSAPSAYKALTRARDTALRSLGAVVVARTGRRDCPQLDALLVGWDGALTPLLRKRIARHIDECEICTARKRRLVSPAALLGSGPAFAIPVRLRTNILAAAARAHGSGAAATAGDSGQVPPDSAPTWRHGWPPGSGPRHHRRMAAWVSAVVAAAVLVAVVSTTVALASGRKDHDARRHDVASNPAANTVGARPNTTGTTETDPTPQVSARAEPGTAHLGGPVPSRGPTDEATDGSTGRTPRPRIDSMTVRCRTADAGGTEVPVLTWVTRHDSGVEIQVSEPGSTVLHRYGTFGPSGSTDLPATDCLPSSGQQIYRLTTTGGTGTAASRTLYWTPPTTSSTPPGSSTAPSGTASVSSSPASPSPTSSPSPSPTSPIVIPGR
jgi:RNA polymerase sigma factor (sigma-70 family)